MKNLFFVICFLSFIPKLSAQVITCSDYCVTAIEMDTVTGFMNVTIYNGDTVHINYPTVQIIDSNGDTVGNPAGLFYLFAQLAGETTIHNIPTTLTSIPPNFICTVLLTDQVWDTTCVFAWPMNCIMALPCIDCINELPLRVYPNPANDFVSVIPNRNVKITDIKIRNVQGFELRNLNINNEKIDLSPFSSGVYIISVSTYDSIFHFRIIRN